MSKPLVIVESPTKIKTIQKYLGNSYNIAATMGHIKDLPQKEIGIDIENGFTPNYVNINGKQKVIQSLKKAADNTSDIYLAPDPDREGEAIAWHVKELLDNKKRTFHRVLFHELTKNAIISSIAAAQTLNKNKYEAQQTRRILDRIVGYQISPLLWKKVKRGLSAGRVQSVAVRIITDRERAIQAFVPEEYWSMTATLEADSPPLFIAKLVSENNKKISIPDKNAASAILKELKGQTFKIVSIKKKTTKRNPLPPFITSTLQQDAIRKLRFSAKKVMLIAQQLYEGVEINGEPVGLITYMRTDSIRIAQEAAQDTLTFIKNTFGDKYSIKEPRFFKNKKKTQDAHEAIRPTSVALTPDGIGSYLTPDQLSLYRLIWQRFVASQMQPALIDGISIGIEAKKYQFQASGSSIQFPGFMAVYMTLEDEEEKNAKKLQLPPLSEGMTVKCNQLDPKQHFTQPPPRFSEASLVKELEENGIGRPSTYATIISTIQEKNYVERNNGYFRPTEFGYIVTDLLVDKFPEILDVEFTAKMEDELDRIEQAQEEPLKTLSNFYNSFKHRLDEAQETMSSVKGVGLPTNMICPECGKKQLHIKNGKNGLFLACSGYPDCNYTNNYSRDEKGNIKPEDVNQVEFSDQKCEKCGKPLVVKKGRYGTFLACSGYPDCKFTQSLNGDKNQAASTGVHCPKENCDGEIVLKKSKRGKIFYGCNKFPKCDYAIWNKPIPEPCPECKAPFVLEKTSKKNGTIRFCQAENCKYKIQIETEVKPDEETENDNDD